MMKKLPTVCSSTTGVASGLGLVEIMATLCMVLAAGMISHSAAVAGWRALETARLEASGLAGAQDKMEELIALPGSHRVSGQDEWQRGASRFTRIWRVSPWDDHPGLQRLEVRTRWWDGDLVVLDLVAVAP